MNMTTEPIRLPAWATAILLVLGPPLATVLAGGEWRQAVATAILGLVAGGGVIARAESIRARTDSPATVDQRLSELAAGHLVVLPEDEREGCAHPAEG